MKSLSKSQVFLSSFIGLLALMVLAAPGALLAHGVVWEMSSKKTYGLEFAYDDGTPMSYVEIKVFGPDDQGKLTQTGRTDERGTFAFIPAAGGQWLVTADDGAGHLAKADLVVDLTASDESGNERQAHAAVNLDREIDKATKPLKIALVISVFIALAAVWTAVQGKKKRAAE